MKQDLRHYNFSDLPAVAETVDGELTDGQRQLLETLYAEVCTTWRALHDVRFKLLGLVPFVTVGILVFLFPGGGIYKTALLAGQTHTWCRARGHAWTTGL
ncbi:MAG: hypothetical protein KZQ85_07335 [Candidatus Thiodiazotropha sp. (ex Myrtea sp. 'scaly one' KF741663)]|nr:hypothetical protein [Candidatus Thiodiazotropha sp. (ex Myrtea sp. 'scaly one' KF741663)]